MNKNLINGKRWEMIVLLRIIEPNNHFIKYYLNLDNFCGGPFDPRWRRPDFFIRSCLSGRYPNLMIECKYRTVYSRSTVEICSPEAVEYYRKAAWANTSVYIALAIGQHKRGWIDRCYLIPLSEARCTMTLEELERYSWDWKRYPFYNANTGRLIA